MISTPKSERHVVESLGCDYRAEQLAAKDRHDDFMDVEKRLEVDCNT